MQVRCRKNHYCCSGLLSVGSRLRLNNCREISCPVNRGTSGRGVTMRTHYTARISHSVAIVMHKDILTNNIFPKYFHNTTDKCVHPRRRQAHSTEMRKSTPEPSTHVSRPSCRRPSATRNQSCD
jgi:hypothetical protein